MPHNHGQKPASTPAPKGRAQCVSSARWDPRGGLPEPAKRRAVPTATGRRRLDHEHTAFTFLGFTFRARKAINSRNGTHFTSFLPAISAEALKAKSAELRAMRIHACTDHALDDLAGWLNPIVSGWMNYYGQQSRSAFYPLLQRVNTYLRRWAAKKYRRLRTHKRFRQWWDAVLERAPGLFVHWKWVTWY